MSHETITPFALTVPDAVRFSGLNRSALYRLMSEGKLTPRKVGKRTLLLTDDLRNVLETAPAAPIRRTAPANAA